MAIELPRRRYEVYVGVLYEKEIDFVAMKDGYKYHIQVGYDISREDTFKREVEPLLKIYNPKKGLKKWLKIGI